MKTKISDESHIAFLLIALFVSVTRATSEEDVAFSTTGETPIDDYSTSNSTVFYKNKFMVFRHDVSVVEVYEDRMIPYETRIRRVLRPPPEGVVVRVSSPVSDRLIVVETSDGKKWNYERFKLRRVDEPVSATLPMSM